MRKLSTIILLSASFLTQHAMADMSSMTNNNPCVTIVKACLDGGYTRDDSSQKEFWQGCMKPLLLGKTVDSVTVDPAVIKSCRTMKIEEMKKELKELQAIRNNKKS